MIARGDTVDILIAFINKKRQKVSVIDPTIEIYTNGTLLSGFPANLTDAGSSNYTYEYTIAPTADLGRYSIIAKGEFGGNDIIVRQFFDVHDLNEQIEDLSMNIQDEFVDLKNKVDDIQEDIGDPSAEGSNLNIKIDFLQDNVGTPALCGESLDNKLDDIKVGLGLSTITGSVKITGTVTDEKGNPIEGVRVIAYDKQDFSPKNTTTTDSTGTYILYLNPGNYVFEFFKECVIITKQVEVEVLSEPPEMILENLELVAKRLVRDKVEDPTTSQPIVSVLVKAILESNYNPDDPNQLVESAAYTDVDGFFELALFPGVYIFEYVKNGYAPLSQKREVF